MKRRLWIIGGLTLIVGVICGIGWWLGWFARGPSAVFKDTLAQANAGHYEAATRNLATGNQRELTEDPKLMKQVWDDITKNRTIASVDITEEDRVTGREGMIYFVIAYQDGSSIKGKALVLFRERRWCHTIHDLLDVVLEAKRKKNFEAMKVVLSDTYTQVPDTGVSLRLPQGMVEAPGKKIFKHPKHQIVIEIRRSPWTSFSGEIQRLDKFWAEHSDTTLY